VPEVVRRVGACRILGHGPDHDGRGEHVETHRRKPCALRAGLGRWLLAETGDAPLVVAVDDAVELHLFRRNRDDGNGRVAPRSRWNSSIWHTSI